MSTLGAYNIPGQLHYTTVMARIWRFVLLLLSCSIYSTIAHIIEVQASQKECFFEDLHINDKVRVIVTMLCISVMTAVPQMTVTYQVGGGGNLDIDFWVWSSYPVGAYRSWFCLACRPEQLSPRQTFEAVDRLCIHNSWSGWTIRILFLEYDEYCCG